MPNSGPSKPRALLSPGVRHDSTPLERALLIARRNWVLLLVCLVVSPAAALVYSLLQTPEYTASASLLFTERDASQVDPARAAATNLQLVSLDQIAARTARALRGSGLTFSEVSEKVSVKPAGESDLVKIAATDPDPRFSSTIANEFARQFIAFRRDANRAKILRTQDLVKSRLAELTPAQLRGSEGKALKKRRGELAIRAALQTGEAQLVEPATIPDSPSSPKTTRNVALGILLGLVLGISLALLRDQFDRRLKTADEAQSAFGLIIATIPQSHQLGGNTLNGEGMPIGEEVEAFRILRANLQYFNIDMKVKSILITSPGPEDGKTTVAWNLARVEAQAGKRVLIVEADLRRPTLVEQLHLTGEGGLSLVLAGKLEAQAAVQKAQGVAVLPAGPLPPNPAELIDSKRMEKLLDWAEGKYDRVIVDTPPAAVVADALPLIRWVDRVLVVVRLRRTHRDAAEHLREQLSIIGAPMIGVVVNGSTEKSDDSYYRSPGITDAFAQTPEKTAPSDAGNAPL